MRVAFLPLELLLLDPALVLFRRPRCIRTVPLSEQLGLHLNPPQKAAEASAEGARKLVVVAAAEPADPEEGCETVELVGLPRLQIAQQVEVELGHGLCGGTLGG